MTTAWECVKMDLCHCEMRPSMEREAQDDMYEEGSERKHNSVRARVTCGGSGRSQG